MLQASRARLFKEYKEVQREKSADPDIQLVCDDSNIFKWTALIKLAFSVPEQYPLQPPQVRFLTKIFHPNVHFKTVNLSYPDTGADPRVGCFIFKILRSLDVDPNLDTGAGTSSVFGHGYGDSICKT
uniref:UBC core domain-containing protein n=1 Tax=Daucus carota subsp. sativus TaxID=79200 RepID=A0A166HW31_DAUCS